MVVKFVCIVVLSMWECCGDSLESILLAKGHNSRRDCCSSKVVHCFTLLGMFIGMICSYDLLLFVDSPGEVIEGTAVWKGCHMTAAYQGALH